MVAVFVVAVTCGVAGRVERWQSESLWHDAKPFRTMWNGTQPHVLDGNEAAIMHAMARAQRACYWFDMAAVVLLAIGSSLSVIDWHRARRLRP